MSDLPSDFRDRLDLRQIIVDIDRKRQETEKFVAEQRKLMAEADKLAAEGRKYERERRLAPWVFGAGSAAALIASLVSLAKSMHWL
jgi:hypothetical protein